MRPADDRDALGAAEGGPLGGLEREGARPEDDDLLAGDGRGALGERRRRPRRRKRRRRSALGVVFFVPLLLVPARVADDPLEGGRRGQPSLLGGHRPSQGPRRDDHRRGPQPPPLDDDFFLSSFGPSSSSSGPLRPEPLVPLTGRGAHVQLIVDEEAAGCSGPLLLLGGRREALGDRRHARAARRHRRNARLPRVFRDRRQHGVGLRSGPGVEIDALAHVPLVEVGVGLFFVEIG